MDAFVLASTFLIVSTKKRRKGIVNNMIKLQMPTADLLAAITVVQKSVGSRSPIPILHDIKLENDGDGHLTLHATNLEMYASVTIGVDYNGTGESSEKAWILAVPAKTLADVVGTVASEKVQLFVTNKGTALRVETPNSGATINAHNADDFPISPDIAAGAQIMMPVDILLQTIGRVAYAARKDESLPKLTGIETTIRDGVLRMAATDGYRLSIASTKVEDVDGGLTIIAPAKILLEFARVATNGVCENIHVLINENRISFVFTDYTANLSNVMISGSLIDARFPDYRAIIPKNKTTSITVSVTEMKQAVKAAKLMAKDNAGIVRLIIDVERNPRFNLDDTSSLESETTGFGTLTVQAKSDEYGEIEQTIKIRCSGLSTIISFNVDYLTEMVTAISSGEFTMELTEPTRPAKITGMGIGEDEHLQVMMPMHPTRA